jgi:lipopolysaccharide assembly protein B
MKIDYGQLIGILTEYVNKNQDDTEFYSLLGSVLREAGYILKAVKIHRNILAKPSLNKQAKLKNMVELAKDLSAHGNFDQSKKLAEKVLETDSKNQDALNLTLHIAIKRGDFETAADMAEKMPNLDPKIMSSVYTDCAAGLFSKGQHHKARKYLKKAIAKHKDNLDAYIYLGDCELKDKKYKEAIENYFEAINRNQAYTTYVITRIENAFYQNNAFNEYSTRIRQELSEKVDNSDMHYALGKFLKKRHLADEAQYEFKKAIEFNPTHIEAREEMVNALLDAKNTDRLRSELKDFFTEIRKNMFYFCTKCSNREREIRWKCPVCGSFDTYEKRIFLF